MREEARWWMTTAEGDLRGPRVLKDAAQFNLAAFHAQQAAEKALKAVMVAHRQVQRGRACHSLMGALEDEGVPVPPELESAARRLDLHYVQSRYPNGLAVTLRNTTTPR